MQRREVDADRRSRRAAWFTLALHPVDVDGLMAAPIERLLKELGDDTTAIDCVKQAIELSNAEGVPEDYRAGLRTLLECWSRPAPPPPPVNSR